MLAIAALAYALAFYKLNGQAFITVGQAFLVYLTKNKLYVWKKEIPQTKQQPIPVPQPPVAAPEENKELTSRRIQDLARNLDILDKTRYN